MAGQNATAVGIKERANRITAPERFMTSDKAADYLSEQVNKGEITFKKPAKPGRMLKRTVL
jgi:hypothetical protein